MPLESFRGSQAPCRAVCGTCGFLRTMHGGVSAPSCCAFTHRVSFEEVSRHQVLINSRPGNRGRSACGTTHVASLQFPRETGVILMCAWKAGNPLQTSQGNRLSCRDQEGRRAQMKWCRELRCSPQVRPVYQGTFGVASRVQSTVSQVKMERGTSFETLYRIRASSCDYEGTTWFFSSCSGILELRRGSQASSCAFPESPIFHLTCEGELGVALESLQDKDTSSRLVSRN